MEENIPRFAKKYNIARIEYDHYGDPKEGRWSCYWWGKPKEKEHGMWGLQRETPERCVQDWKDGLIKGNFSMDRNFDEVK